MTRREGKGEERPASFYRVLVETSQDIHTVTDRDGTCRYQSPAIERVLGYTQDELLGKNAFSFIHPEDLEALDEAYEALLSEPGSSQQVKVRVRHKKGHWIHLDTLARNELDNPELRGLFLASRDITEAEVARRLLEKREQHMRAVVSHQNFVLWGIDATGVITFSEGEGLRNLGLESAQLVGANIFDMYAHDEVVVGHVRRALAGESLEYFHEIPGPKGLLSFENLLMPHRDSKGQVEAVTAITIDVSERVHLARELRRARTLEAIGMLAGGIAHDFNNLLTAMVGFSTAARQSVGEEQVAYIDQVLRSAERGAALVNQLLSFARKDEVKPVVIDLHALIEDLRPLLEQVAGPEVRVKVEVCEDAGPWAVEVDQNKFEQVLVNLTSNARDAMPSGGAVKYRLRRIEDEEGSQILIEVIDNGEGIDSASIEHVFDPFYSTRQEGSGLGLATARSVVMRSGGRIEVESSKGLGSCFRIYLPASSEEPARRARMQSESGEEVSGTILLIDDNLAVLNSTAAALELAGFQVRKANSGQEGYETFLRERERIDLLMTDLTMPGMKGDELIRRVRNFDSTTPILCVSGFHEGTDSLEELPRVTLLSKPYLGDEPISTIAKLLRDRS